jgi:membrane protein
LLFLINQLIKDNVFTVAGSLAFTTLLAVVPFAVVVFSSLASFPIFEDSFDKINTFIFDNFVPTSGEVIQTYLLLFIQQTSALTPFGIVFLFITAVMLMFTIDNEINRIWQVSSKRSMVTSAVVYFLILTVGPMLVGISLILTSYLASLPFLGVVELEIRFLTFLPFLLTAMAFATLYYLVPNTRTPIWHAVVGGVVAALLFELAKHLFKWYVTQFSMYQIVYGALSAVPIFLIWIYISWVIVLFGAELTRCMHLYRQG